MNALFARTNRRVGQRRQLEYSTTRISARRRGPDAPRTLVLVAHTLRAWMGIPWPGRRCSTGSDRRRAAVLSAATSSTVSGADRAAPRAVMTASPESRVWESLCQKATLSSVWPGVLITVHADAPAMLAPSSSGCVGRGPRHRMPREVPKPAVAVPRANPITALARR
jgi:hypothetical protein